MKHFNFTFKLLFLFVVGALLFPSCDPEPMDNSNAATVSLVNETGFIFSETTIAAGELINVKVTASKGDADMNSFTVKQDGTSLSPSDFTNASFSITNNPQVLVDGDRTSFTYELAIEPHGSGTATYSFEVIGSDQTTGRAEVDITIDDVVVEPVLVNNMNANIIIDQPGTVQIVLTATAGSSPLSTVAVYDGNDDLISADRLSWEGEAIDANPYELLEADKSGFTDKKMFLMSSNIVGDQMYTITITDEAGNTSTIPYTITLTSSTPFTNEFTAVKMYNNAGTNFGAVDLETGTNVSSGNAAADLVDGSIDGDGNWLQIMSPVSGSGTILKSIDGASYTYDNVTSRELVILAYNSGSEISTTGTLSVGSTYVASMGDTYYILTVTSVNPTSADNNDFLEFSIKKSTL